MKSHLIVGTAGCVFLSLSLVLLIFPEAGFSQDDSNDTLFSSIDSVLKISLEDSLRYYFLTENPNSKYATMQRMTFQAQTVNLSAPLGLRDDYIIAADLETGKLDWKAATTIILCFINTGKGYEQRVRWIGWNKSFQMRPELIDIDSDSIQEILIKEDDSGNQGTHFYMTLWKYIQGQFQVVFQQGLDEGGGVFPYSYSNRYSFVKNANNPLLLDIRFTVDAGVAIHDDDYDQKSVEKISRGYGIELPKHVHQEVLFSFDGSRYVPTVEVYDYGKPFRVYFENDK